MKHILPFDGPIADFMRENYQTLKDEFFNYGMSPFVFPKPKYIRDNGVLLYSGKINIIPLKLAKVLLDRNERIAANWVTDEATHRFPVKTRRPDDYAKMVTWDKMLTEFENEIEQVFFNIAYPGASLSYHYGVSKHCWRAHVCMQENQGFTFVIEDEQTKWFEGMDHSFKFDDGNLWHGVEYVEINDATPRIACIIDYKK